MKRAIIDLNIEPRIYTIDNFLSPAECKHLIATAKGMEMNRAFISGAKAGAVSDVRTNTVCWVNHFRDTSTKRIANRVAGLVGLPISYAERFQVVHYSVGQEYRPHFDAFDPKSKSAPRTMKSGGQRLITVLGYLNDVPAGGATEFPELGIKIPAQRGKILVFHNCIPGTKERHTDTLHAGCPVEEGEKWAFNLWFRESTRQKQI